MYNNKFVACVKANGKILREIDDSVKIPFSSEYSILLKNLNTVRAQVKITIDGIDLGDGTSFIIPANDSIEIERFVKNRNLGQGNRLKFIERTEKIEDARGGIQAEDGLIRVEFEFERQNVPLVNTYNTNWCYNWNWNWPYYYPPVYGTGVVGKGSCTGGNSSTLGTSFVNYSNNIGSTSAVNYTATATANTASTTSEATAAAASIYTCTGNTGITVPGSVSDQTFTHTYGIWGDGVKHAMVIRLLGKVGSTKVEKPITVNAKQKCTTCGRQNKSSAKFCAECGTSLILL